METQNEYKKTYFVFQKRDIPELHWWKDIDCIKNDYRSTWHCLNDVLSRTTGRVDVDRCYYSIYSYVEQIERCYKPTDEEWYYLNQAFENGLPSANIKLYEVFINTTDYKQLAKEIYDDLRFNIRDLDDVTKELITERAKQWLSDVEKDSGFDLTPQEAVNCVVEQLIKCTEPVQGGKYIHIPYCRYFDPEKPDENEFDLWGYRINNIDLLWENRLTARECNMLIEAYKVWARLYQNPVTTLNEQSDDEQSQQETPPTAQHKTSGKKGRPTKQFRDLMLNDESGEKLSKMHDVLKGKTGKDFVLIIVACIKKGWITKPTYTQAKNEFGDIGSKQNFASYLNNERAFTSNEIDGALNSLN